MSNNALRLVVLLVPLLVTSACGDSFVPPDKNNPVMTDHGKFIRSRDEVAAIVDKEIAVGSSADDVEQFYKRHRLGCSFDEFANRYQCLSRVTKLHAIMIYISVDDRRRVVHTEIRDSFTGL
jgi:hypothetical protein